MYSNQVQNHEVVIIYKKVLVAIDKSENSNRVIEKVIDLKKSWNCNVVIFNSIKHTAKFILAHIATATGSGSYYINERELLNEYKKEGDNLLLAKKELFNNEDLPVEIRLITDEAPEKYIERIVKEEGFDLIVIGTKGIHSKLNQFFLGSVAKRVVKHAACDVLIVR